jgi:5-methylcytosine-specific restriction endonuclease McrA
VREFPEGAWIEDVDLDVLYKRDEGVCGLCLKPCSRNQASRDHIVPISRGGKHEYSNVRLTHKKCNSYKGDKMDDEIIIPRKRGRKGRNAIT